MALFDIAELELNDARVEFMADYVLKTLRLKGDKWTKMYNLEENKQMFMDFFERQEFVVLCVIANAAGGLNVILDWPDKVKQKSCYFVKKRKEGVAKDCNMRSTLIFGDLSYNPVEQLSALVDEVQYGAMLARCFRSMLIPHDLHHLLPKIHRLFKKQYKLTHFTTMRAILCNSL